MEILNDFDTSVRRALEEINNKYFRLPGLVVCGTHNPHDMEKLIEAIKWARERRKPYLGICFGHQLAAIEYARNVLDIRDATSEEWGQGTFIVKKRPEGLYIGLHNGETYWNNYEVDSGFEGKWDKPSHFITMQYHPEYESFKGNPHPKLIEFIELCQRSV